MLLNATRISFLRQFVATVSGGHGAVAADFTSVGATDFSANCYAFGLALVASEVSHEIQFHIQACEDGRIMTDSLTIVS